jgi:hypothetical protein
MCWPWLLASVDSLLLIEDGQPTGRSHVRDLIAAEVDQVKEKIAGLLIELGSVWQRLKSNAAQPSRGLAVPNARFSSSWNRDARED